MTWSLQRDRLLPTVAVITSFLWCSYELLLYGHRIVPYCPNAIFIYGTILTAVHTIFIYFVLCGCLTAFVCDL